MLLKKTDVGAHLSFSIFPLTKGVTVTSSHSLFSSVLGYMKGGWGTVMVSPVEFFLLVAAASVIWNSSERRKGVKT